MFFQLPTLTCLGSTRCISFSYYPSLSLSLSLFHAPFLISLQETCPGSLGLLKSIISLERYPSVLTSEISGWLPFSLNGLINPSRLLNSLDFIVLCNPLSSIHPSSHPLPLPRLVHVVRIWPRLWCMRNFVDCK